MSKNNLNCRKYEKNKNKRKFKESTCSNDPFFDIEILNTFSIKKESLDLQLVESTEYHNTSLNEKTISNPKQMILKKIIKKLKTNQKTNIISIFGIGSFFDKSLPSDWKINDIDIIVIVKNLDSFKKLDWTDKIYKKFVLDGYQVWIGYNTINSLFNKELFRIESWANYEWSILDLRNSKNSILIEGKDIRSELLKITIKKFNYDDILLRSLYHIEKSLMYLHRYENSYKSMIHFTKAIFKICFYLCVLNYKKTIFTSKRHISVKIQELVNKKKINKKFLDYLKYCIFFRRNGYFPRNVDFEGIRNQFINLVFSLLLKERLHREMSINDLIRYLEDSFRREENKNNNSFYYLSRIVRKMKN